MTKKVGIDGDVLRYRCGFAAEGEPVSFALHSTKLQIESILDVTEADDYSIFLTGKGNFRYDIATIAPYKGNRSGRKPEHYDAITEYLTGVWKAEVIEGMEADDAMSIEAKRLYPNYCIATIDKDLDIVAGDHYNFAKDEYYTTDTWGGLGLDQSKSKPKCTGAGLMFFYAQMLMGDAVDNIKGCPRIGDVKAYNILKDCETEQELFCEVGKQYALKYDDPEAALLENGRLLWMLEEEDKMWEFPE